MVSNSTSQTRTPDNAFEQPVVLGTMVRAQLALHSAPHVRLGARRPAAQREG